MRQKKRWHQHKHPQRQQGGEAAPAGGFPPGERSSQPVTFLANTPASAEPHHHRQSGAGGSALAPKPREPRLTQS